MATLDLRRVVTSNRVIRELKMLLHFLCLRIRYGSRVLYYIYGSRVCPSAWLGLLGARRNKVIYHTQDFLEPRRHKLYEFFEKRLAKRAGHVVINDENRARFMKSHYGLEDLPTVVRTYLPATWPIPEFDANRRAELLSALTVKATGDEKLIMCQGAYYPQERCSENLIEAVASLGKDYYILFSGMKTGSHAECQAKCSLDRHGLGPRAIFLGYLSYGSLLNTTAACDIGVLLYPNDGIGNFCQCPGRFTEYLRCGVPVLMSNFPNFKYLALKYGVGVTCDPHDPQSIKRSLERLGARSPKQVEMDRERLKRLALEDLCYEKEFATLKEVVDAALTRGRM